MKYITFSMISMLAFLVLSCGNNADSGNSSNSSGESAPDESATPALNKGIGPVTQVTLASTIDNARAEEGQKLYEQFCTACHKPTERFIGPAPLGVLDRRTPEWVMNMILNPEEMIQEDPDAKALLMEFNGAPMANQHLTEDQARAILEYFRTL